ncbi:copper resistance protein NlpE N-terminal domain-containing protein [Flavobacterium sp. LC2016-12]|uniref:copper resistance protein NlpE N-terminal domain-containing protein n=1 Tax=Flavobacterium sp. LC2016-12 TaxID=2783794 RepID=UPI00188C6030|nr:copper resistance protein NlpE N-terminal domain-containing protein [Flavobacterium sp. LC2016-12]MBF4463631.1 copper resistance protein NlpE N-terminal domain-containing protein [Flavobacterium sp. LC2016-12]
MKLITTILFLIFNLTLFAQSNQFAGEYQRTLEDTQNKHLIEYKLTLNQDGTFLFHSYSKTNGGVPPEVNKYGKGKWTAKDNLITFSSNKQEDLDTKYTLDFNKSTARFVTKNPRDKSDKIVKTRLTFLESGIFWMERIDVFKI